MSRPVVKAATALVGGLVLALLFTGWREVLSAFGDPRFYLTQGTSGRAVRGTDWRMQGMRKVIQDGEGLRASITAEKAELHGMPLLSFRFAPIKQLELQDLRVRIEDADGVAETPDVIVDALAPASPNDAVAAVVVHGISIDYPGSDPADACSISAANARWAPGGPSGSVTLALHGDVHVRVGETEQVVDAIHLQFRRDGIAVYDTVPFRGTVILSPDAGPGTFCRVLS